MTKTAAIDTCRWGRHFSSGKLQGCTDPSGLGMRMSRNGRMERSFFDQTGPTGKRGPPQKVDQFFRNSSGWTEPIH